ncbi:MAG: hypothetical protein IKJ33_02595 [Clostridia bacterium]|nr:hypothetical protein [Clostridia bacterium]
MKKLFKDIWGWIKIHKILTIFLVLLITSASIIIPISLKKQHSIKKPINLKNNECIVINGTRYVNQEITTKENITKTFTLKNTYNLKRSTNTPISTTEYAYLNGYYYYWDTVTTTTEIEIGTILTTTQIKYSYLPYKQNEEILLIKETSVNKKYKNETGWKEHSFEYEVKLNGYFPDLDSLKTALGEFGYLINTTGKEKYYLEPNFPEETNYNNQTFKSYYYIEKI